MCEVVVSFAWSGKKPGQHSGKQTEFVTDTYTKWVVGVETSKVVVSILENLVKAWFEKRFSLYNVNGGSGGKSCVGDGTVYLTIQEDPFAAHDIQVCVQRKVVEMNSVAMRKLLQGDTLSKFERHVLHHESMKVEQSEVEGVVEFYDHWTNSILQQLKRKLWKITVYCVTNNLGRLGPVDIW
jgi:hypothetical protein